MVLKQLSVILVIFLSSTIWAQSLPIRIYEGIKTNQLQCVIGSGQYLIIAHHENGIPTTVLLQTLEQGRFKIKGSLLQFYQGTNLIAQGSHFELIQRNQEDFVNWSVPEISTKIRSYEGDFELTIVKGQIQLINNVELETYLEGVVSCEGGSGHHQSYYQTQAIISRTYALAYQNRHQKDGYALCDRVHCQAYLHKRIGTTLIDSSVYSTQNIVLLDANGNYFPTFFHANCGGQTCPPEYVWNQPIEGLYSFKDTFCIHTKQATWVKNIALSKWTAFLTTKYNFPIDDSVSLKLLQNFKSEDRTAFYIHPVYGIPMRDLRDEFNLKSSFFNAEIKDQQVILSGRGFGHGVGLCQEGAMKMAKEGYKYDQILRYYFPGAIISRNKTLIHE